MESSIKQISELGGEIMGRLAKGAKPSVIFDSLDKQYWEEIATNMMIITMDFLENWKLNG